MTSMLEIKYLTEKDLPDFIALIRVFEKVFEMENFVLPEASHLKDLMAKPDFLPVVAKRDNQVIGGLTIYILHQYYSPRPLAYLYDLAVLTEYQRQGIGGELIAYTNKYCQDQGIEEVFVQADKVDEYALDFYRKTRPTAEEEVVHFYYTL